MQKSAIKSADPAVAKLEPEWRIASAPVPYTEAIETMERRVAVIEAGTAGELIWLVTHPPLYTAGTSAAKDELLDAQFPVFQTGRGGRFTYHGPGQRVIYCMMDLRKHGRDVRAHVCQLKDRVIRVLKDFGVKGERRTGRIGIWVDHKGREEKIAAIGVRVRRWVTYHGLSFNVAPDLSHYKGIVPCGLPDFGVTSLAALGVKAAMEDVDQKFREHQSVLISR